jgi:predicted CopG family antitoxin
MENILDPIKVKRWKNIMISKEVANRLKSMNQGSYTKTLEKLLDMHPDTRTKIRLEELEKEIGNMQDLIEKLVRINNLKI